MNPMVEALLARADALTARVLDEMYRNPFWAERFGDRGRRHATADGNYHLEYLAQALLAGDAGILESYARWLQTVLVSRGMCTRHLAENFRRLAAAIADEGLDGAATAVDYLRQAERALLYADETPRAVQLAAPAIAARVAGAVYARHPDWRARWGDAGVARCADDVEYHLSYVADALVVRRADLLQGYLGWIEACLARRQVPPEHLHETLDLLSAELASTEATRPAATLMGRARATLARNAVTA